MQEQRPPISNKQPNNGLSSVIKFVIVASSGFMFLMVALVSFVFYVGAAGPEIEVLAGSQVPIRYVDTIRELGLLAGDEEILYFYSDAILDITDGFYLLTNQKVVVYSTSYPEPTIRIPFHDIDELNIQYDDSFFIDSTIWITRDSGSTVSFPVSSEGGGDKRFFEALEERHNRASRS